MRVHPFALSCLIVAVLAPAACSDPIRDRRMLEVGEEDAQGPSENHRAGQDCLLCHDAEGGATPEMVVAGTVYKDNSAGSEGAADVEIEFVDANNGSPLQNPITRPSGNFWVPKQDWPRLTFPFRTRLKVGDNPVPMISTVNREGSCNFCHRPNPAEPYDELEKELARRSTGQIYVSLQAPGGT